MDGKTLAILLALLSGAAACHGLEPEEEDRLGAQTPLPPGLPEVDHLDVDRVEGRQACAVAVDGGVWCWRLDVPAAQREPEQIAGTRERVALSVSVAPRHACAYTVNGRLMCWRSGHPGP